MIINHAMADDKTAVERWENEGGRTSPFTAVTASLRPMTFRTKNNSIQPVAGDQKKLSNPKVFSGFSIFDPRRRSNDAQTQSENQFWPAAS